MKRNMKLPLATRVSVGGGSRRLEIGVYSELRAERENCLERII
jgi:hypothetical protein